VPDRKLVELVDPDGNALGECSVTEAHTPPGRLHRAFSVLLFDSDGRVLMHQRALTKSRFAGRWTNTCCSHPAPGHDLATSAGQRLDEELGLRVDALREVGRFVYRAADPASGTVEHEYDHVLVGRCDDDPTPDPAEIHSWRWIAPARVRDELAASPETHSPWLVDVLRLSLE